MQPELAEGVESKGRQGDGSNSQSLRIDQHGNDFVGFGRSKINSLEKTSLIEPPIEFGIEYSCSVSGLGIKSDKTKGGENETRFDNTLQAKGIVNPLASSDGTD